MGYVKGECIWEMDWWRRGGVALQVSFEDPRPFQRVSEEDFQGTSGAFWRIPRGGALRFGGYDWKISKAICGMGVGGRENSWDV